MSVSMGAVDPRVSVYCMTYRRPHLLQRALRSVQNQTEACWICRVVNDDPEDERVAELVGNLEDQRFTLFQPAKRRGGAANFNLAFRDSACPFAAILEDDNWWEPAFLSSMLAAFHKHPDLEVACSNEELWNERADGTWEDTGRAVWPTRQGQSLWTTPFHEACGSSVLCNSALLFRTRNSREWATPDDIPVDVTEHFRERCIPQPVILVHQPLVNYARTLATNRSIRSNQWRDYQSLLIASCFHALPPDRRMEHARLLWRHAGSRYTPRSASFLFAALSFTEAAALWRTAPIVQRIRFLATLARRPLAVPSALTVRAHCHEHWKFLCESPYNRELHDAQSALGGRSAASRG